MAQAIETSFAIMQVDRKPRPHPQQRRAHGGSEAQRRLAAADEAASFMEMKVLSTTISISTNCCPSSSSSSSKSSGVVILESIQAPLARSESDHEPSSAEPLKLGVVEGADVPDKGETWRWPRPPDLAELSAALSCGFMAVMPNGGNASGRFMAQATAAVAAMRPRCGCASNALGAGLRSCCVPCANVQRSPNRHLPISMN
mmetsp:Transcript_124411/g.243985  ORF Transcript_124411/g.243985 Transcript_124411/m.243985 type:complete len:201 (+) Transcript_124411:404-1006(+)